MRRKLKSVSLVFILFFLISSLIFFPLSSPANSSNFDMSSDVLDQRPRLFGNATDEGIELEWSFSTDEEIKKIRIFRSLSSNFKELYDEIEEDTSNYLDDDVEEGRTYSYWLTALFEEETRFSEELRMTAKGENEPLPPRNLEAFPGDSKVTLRWDRPLDPDVNEITHYSLYREKEDEELSTETPGNSAQEWVDRDLENGKEYTYRLRAENDEGESEEVKAATTPRDDLPLPEKPINFNAFLGEKSVELTWEAPENDEHILDYKLYRDGEEIEDENIPIPRDKNYFVDENVNIGEVCNYSISSINVDGKESARSRNRTIRVGEGRYLFSIERNIRNIMSDLDEGSISERYRDKSEEEGYTLSREEHVFVTVKEEGERWKLRDEIEGYNHNIRKENEKLIVYEERKGSPGLFELEAGDQEIKISWEEVPEAEDEKIRYNIYRGENEDEMTLLTHVEEGLEFTDEGVENGRVYHYNVRAVGPENVLGNATETRHSVPMEQTEESLSIWTVIGYGLIIAIGIIAIFMVMRTREPEGPDTEENTEEK